MPVISINYSLNDTMPDMLETKAKEFDLTVEQLVKRFITASMIDYVRTEQSLEAETLEEFVALNGIKKILT